ncbi:MAG TPA: hypothetical protein VF074_07555, partial [Pyrinomonadaceae bacterium]
MARKAPTVLGLMFSQLRGKRSCENMWFRFYFFFPNRRRAPAATPIKPVPNSNMLAGSGTGV